LGETAFAFAGVGLFFFDLAAVFLAVDFFFADLDFGVASGVSLGVGVALASARAFFFDLDFGFGDGEAVLPFAALRLGDGVGDSSGVADADARVLGNSACFSFSWSLTCA